ncbi:hypothetical protein LAV72_01330 [Lysinibacillus xylanilyticus]|nr:hypothetical protein [Lysinibacillus xylanilyticus]
MSRLGQQMSFARKRECNVAAAEGFFVRKRSDSSSRMLVTKALSQDVMLLAFVPLSLIPEESPNLHSNQLKYRAYIFKLFAYEPFLSSFRKYFL